MSTPDQRFFDVFMIVIGSLVAVAVGLVVTARSIGSEAQREWIREYRIYGDVVAGRLRPAGRARLPGEAGAIAAEAVATPAPAPRSGSLVYEQSCSACHGAGIAGAPKFGEKAAWSARLAQGREVLYRHALEGFQGSGGIMPARGGVADLGDAEVTAAVDFMLDAVR